MNVTGIIDHHGGGPIPPPTFSPPPPLIVSFIFNKDTKFIQFKEFGWKVPAITEYTARKCTMFLESWPLVLISMTGN